MKVEKLENLGMSANQIMVSILLVGIGFSTFYFIPLTFIKQKMTLLFILLNLILILIVVGLTFLCTLFFSLLERAMLWVVLHTCCRRDIKMHQVILKNMEAHSKRNTKTSIMFTLSIAFLIFSASSFELMATVISKLAEQRIGADMYADS